MPSHYPTERPRFRERPSQDRGTHVEAKIDTQQNGIAIVAFTGRLDFLSAGAARTRLADAVEHGSRRLVVDLGEKTFIDSSGLGALIGGLKAARKAGGDLRIAQPTEQARTVLALTSLDRVFRFYPSVREALADYTA
jgi:anti-sigma B factor antagonist